MKVILYMAMSINGIIARENNKEDFLSENNWDTLLELVEKTKCMIWGSNTYKIISSWDKRYLNSLKDITKIIISTDPNFKVLDGFIKSTSPKNSLEILKQKGFESAILTGGSRINASFAKEGLIDEVIINVEPVLIGKGIPLFAKDEFEMRLELKESKKISNNLLQLYYLVKN